MNEELKVFVKNKKKEFFGSGEGGVRLGQGVRLVGWIRVDVKAMLGVGGDVGYGGCEKKFFLGGRVGGGAFWVWGGGGEVGSGGVGWGVRVDVNEKLNFL